ncbi:MAG TPA: class D sortase [Anaerolineales bacterium]
MGKKGSAEDLSVEELRRLLVEKRRASRQERLERFRRTGRVVTVSPDIESSSLEELRSGSIVEEEAQTQVLARSRSKQLFDGLLLSVEILAVLGILFVLFNGVSLIRELNQEVASALEQPTLTPTPLIMAVVLPSGHTPPNSPGGAQPNEAEIPEHLGPLVQSLANIPIPTPGPEQAIRIQIPALNVDAPIVQGDGWEQLKKGVGQHIGTANPGDSGNMVLSAHNDIFGEIFRDLDQLKNGDQVIIHTNQRSYTYVVSGNKTVEPTQVEVMEATSQPKLTLISCYPYLVDDQRIVVSARLQSGN